MRAATAAEMVRDVGRRRSGSGRSANRCPPREGHRVAKLRAEADARGPSSHRTAAFTTTRCIAPGREDPMVFQQHSWTAVLGQSGDDALTAVIAADERERADGDLPAELGRVRG